MKIKRAIATKGKAFRFYLLRSMTGKTFFKLAARLIFFHRLFHFFLLLRGEVLSARKVSFSFDFKAEPERIVKGEGRKIGNFYLLCIRKLHKNKARRKRIFYIFLLLFFANNQEKTRLSDEQKNLKLFSSIHHRVCHDKTRLQDNE